MTPPTGKVILVGAGPGDPELITVRGRKAMASADVVVYDYLASPLLLKYAPGPAEKIYVGKKGPGHARSQRAINQLLVDKARQGLTVVRLKGGDPYLFGRGAEEAVFLAEHEIPFEVEPGVPAAGGAAATAGVPLTDRRYASSVAFVTGHEDPTKTGPSVDWEHLAKAAGTIVLYMAVKNLPSITEKLLRHGRSPDTPAAIVEWATTPRQRIVRGQLGDLAALAREQDVRPPAIVIFGDVNRLGEALNWFEKRPLFGRQIIVTRTATQADSLAAPLRDLGADVIEMPLIEIRPLDDTTALDDAIKRITSYDWLVFTSVNGVESFSQRLTAAGGDARRLAGVRLAVIGPATAKALADRGIRADFLPETYLSDALADGLNELEDLKGKRFLLARSDLAGAVLPKRLRDAGAVVDDVAAYRIVPCEFDRQALAELVTEGQLAAVTFTSPSAVRSLAARLGRDFIREHSGDIPAASLGPVTSAALRELGLEPLLEADEYTIPGLVAKLRECLAR